MSCFVFYYHLYYAQMGTGSKWQGVNVNGEGTMDVFVEGNVSVSIVLLSEHQRKGIIMSSDIVYIIRFALIIVGSALLITLIVCQVIDKIAKRAQKGRQVFIKEKINGRR